MLDADAGVLDKGDVGIISASVKGEVVVLRHVEVFNRDAHRVGVERVEDVDVGENFESLFGSGSSKLFVRFVQFLVELFVFVCFFCVAWIHVEEGHSAGGGEGVLPPAEGVWRCVALCGAALRTLSSNAKK